MYGIASCIHLAVDDDDIADLQRSHLFLGQRRSEYYFAASERETGFLGHFVDRALGIPVKPMGNRSSLRIECHTEPAKGPAIVGNGHKKTRRETIGGRDLATDQRYLSTKSHGSDTQGIGLFHDLGFKLCQLGYRVHVI